MSILSGLFGGGKSSNPAGAAKPYLDQIPGVAHNAYDDYINQGKTSGANAHEAFERLMNDPQGFLNDIMGGYKESDAYKYQSDKLSKALSNTAAAGGVAGTPLDQMNQGEQLQQLLSADQQQYLQNVLGRYDIGLKGEMGEADRGYDASGKLADMLGGNLNQQANNAFQGAQQENTNKNSFMKILMQALGGGVGFATQPTASFFGNKVWG